jgi:branched-chain amino acid transport system permease protein
VDVLNSMGMYAILALSLNIILGYAGLFHMGHAAFFAMGTYTTAILNTQFGIPVLWLMPLSGMVAGFFALIVARPIIHLRGDYLLIVTIGIVEIVRIALVNNVFGITGGANGIFGISRPSLFGYVIRTPHEFYYLIFAFAAITVLPVPASGEFPLRPGPELYPGGRRGRRGQRDRRGPLQAGGLCAGRILGRNGREPSSPPR